MISYQEPNPEGWQILYFSHGETALAGGLVGMVGGGLVGLVVGVIRHQEAKAVIQQ